MGVNGDYIRPGLESGSCYTPNRPYEANLNPDGVALELWDEAQAEEIEAHAIEIARGAGRILVEHFGRQIDVEFKDEQERDPVTAADKAAQEYLSTEIIKRFPEHGILGEEGTKEEKESDEPAKDILWVLDPLDGTTNFMNGLPLFASSIGVLYRGWPMAAALYIPWPTNDGGFVLHCRKGGGCFADDERVSVYESDEPVPSRLIGVPGYFGVLQGFTGELAGKAGEVRTTGSIAYELAMTAKGVLQYAMFGAPRLWDMAGGALAVVEAGGTVMTRFRGEKRWHPMECLVPSWGGKSPTMKELRGWVAPLVAGNPKVAPLIADNVKRRFSISSQFGKLTSPLRRKKNKPAVNPTGTSAKS
jgi:myo-inositol-1(or 4)-monophosphatase